ncbi:hypothetical protein N0V88_006752 [Collariella sp. IMI 366227]|nr:hypothetical protein N0V88_006752 [Collariella sp. IMI 366227]
MAIFLTKSDLADLRHFSRFAVLGRHAAVVKLVFHGRSVGRPQREHYSLTIETHPDKLGPSKTALRSTSAGEARLAAIMTPGGKEVRARIEMRDHEMGIVFVQSGVVFRWGEDVENPGRVDFRFIDNVDKEKGLKVERIGPAAFKVVLEQKPPMMPGGWLWTRPQEKNW